MDESTAGLAAAIGGRVRAERTGRGWTLDQLAEAAGISRRMLVHVEQGAVNPSLGTLLRLSEALGIALPLLVEPPKPEPVSVTRAGDGTVLWRGAGGGHAVMVAGVALPHAFELWLWTLAPGDRHDSEPHPAGTKELLHVHAGTLLLDLGTGTVELRAGDAVAFSGDMAHSYRNDGAEPSVFSGAVFEPTGTR